MKLRNSFTILLIATIMGLVLIYPTPGSAGLILTPAEETTSTVVATTTPQWTVVIDAGHQKHANLHLEPIGPGSKTKRPAVAGGATGRFTHKTEYNTNLSVARLLRDKLVAQGVNVIMVRNANNVNIPNSKRAEIANTVNADLFIRIHCDSNASSQPHGFSTLYPGVNRWTKTISTPSRSAAKILQAATLKETNAANRGVIARTNLAGFNWSKVPVVLVEMGFMSNSKEDRKLATAEYRNKLASGMSNGILDYLETTSEK